MQLKDLRQAVQDLINSNNINGQPTYTMPGFKVENVYPIFKHYFNEKANKTMENKTPRLVHEYNEAVPGGRVLHLLAKLGFKTCSSYINEGDLYTRKIDLVKFIASRATKDKLPLAIEKVINAVNHLADKDFTKASMLELGVLELTSVNGGPVEYVVLSYITLTDAGYNYAQSVMPRMLVAEGALPPKVENQ